MMALAKNYFLLNQTAINIKLSSTATLFLSLTPTLILFEVVSELTIAINVNNIYNDFFTKYVNFNAIYIAEISRLQSDIKGLGLSNKRAKILKDLSKMIMTDYNGELPQDPEILRN